jgi:uncharacterized protein (TIGR03435 family)
MEAAMHQLGHPFGAIVHFATFTTRPLGKRLFFVFTLTIFGFVQSIWAAQPSKTSDGSNNPQFSVASVKRVHKNIEIEEGNVRPGLTTTTSSLRAHNTNLRDCLQWAYNVKTYQLLGPDWLNTEKYEIEAKSDEPVSEEQMRLMLRQLLAERFKMQLEKEDRELPVYALVVDHLGSGLHTTQASNASVKLSPPGFRLVFRKEPLSELANTLSTLSFIDRPVVDRTKLSGEYDFSIDLTAAVRNNDTPSSGPGAVDSPGVSAFTLIREQLGLKMAASKAAFDVLVVQHAERIPTEN